MPKDHVSEPFARPAETAASPFSVPVGDRRLEVLRRFLFAFAVVGLVSVGCFVIVYLRTSAWQILIAGGAILFGLLVGLLTFQMARRGSEEASGYIFLIAVAIVYAALELVWAGATPYLVVAGALLMLVGGSVLLSRRWLSWLILLGYLGLFFVVVNQLEPLPRFDIQRSPILRAYVPILNALIAAGLVLQAIASFRRMGTIRARLLAISIGVVLLTAVAIGAATTLIGYQNGTEQAVERLELVASLRETEIDNWITDVRDTLAASLQQAPEQRYVESDVAAVVASLIDTPEDSADYRDAYGFLDYNFQQWLKQAEGYEVVFFMDRDGTVLISTDPAAEGENLSGEAFFNRGTVGSYLAPPRYEESSGEVYLYSSRPILGEYGRLLGVLAGRVDASNLDRLMRMRERVSLGETGETYVVDRDYRMLTNSRFGAAGTIVRTESVDESIPEEETSGYASREDAPAGTSSYLNYQGEPVIGVYRWLPDLQVVLLAEQSREEAFRAVNRSVILNASIALVAVLIAGGISLYVARDIGDPLSDLAEVASGIAAGDLERMARIDRPDEIGTLADAFNSMTGRLRGLIGQLEERVAERTKELQTRSTYLEASAEVGHAASTMLDAEALTQAVVDLVHDRFELYYVGLFLLDESGEWAELRAGTGKAGRQMIEEGHRLQVGGHSMIGQCVSRRRARIALDVGEEAVRFENPLLPETRSEAALPLQSRGRVYGAITVQSVQPAAFDDATVTVLQTMADQVAVALDNAYLFSEAEESLQAARRASAEMSRQGWANLLRSQPALGYHSDDRGVVRAEMDWRPEVEEAVRVGRTVVVDAGDVEPDPDREGKSQLQPAAVPIRVAGKVIGVLNTYKPTDAGPWSEGEIETLESLAEQMAVSLESARLYQETQSRAAREQMVAEITGRLRSSLDPDTILRTTVRELGSALDAEVASVAIGGRSGDGDGGDDEGERSAGGEEE